MSRFKMPLPSGESEILTYGLDFCTGCSAFSAGKCSRYDEQPKEVKNRRVRYIRSDKCLEENVWTISLTDFEIKPREEKLLEVVENSFNRQLETLERSKYNLSTDTYVEQRFTIEEVREAILFDLRYWFENHRENDQW